MKMLGEIYKAFGLNLWFNENDVAFLHVKIIFKYVTNGTKQGLQYSWWDGIKGNSL
jgi:hypothetical protein